MGAVFNFILSRFSKYLMLLILFTIWMLIFIERKQLLKKGLKKEAVFSLFSGFLYTFILILALINSFIHR